MQILADLWSTAPDFWTWGHVAEHAVLLSFFLLTGTAAFFMGKIRESIYLDMKEKLLASNRLYATTTDSHQEIRELLNRLSIATEAFRVTIFQFHNGDTFMTGNHAWKVSQTHEILHAGANSTVCVNQNLPVSALSDFITPMLNASAPLQPGCHDITECASKKDTCRYAKNGHRVLHYVCEEMVMATMRSMMITQGISHRFTVNLMDMERGGTFGFISLQFLNPSPETLQATVDKACMMCATADSVQFYLSKDFTDVAAKRGRFGWIRRLFS